jgi:hypothetical protein
MGEDMNGTIVYIGKCLIKDQISTNEHGLNNL